MNAAKACPRPRHRALEFGWAVLLIFSSVLLLNFSVSAAASAPAGENAGATVTFAIDFPGSDPDHYTILVQSDGRAHYACSAKVSPASEERESYQSDFTFSDATRARIFDLAKQARYFSGKIDSGNRKLANTGAKTLSYNDGQRNNSATYNFSPVPAVEQLTTLFQSVSATLEYGRHLTYFHRYQKLALDDELKRMEDQIHHGELMEVQAVKPVLQAIYDDSSVLNVVRARAQRIMEMSPAGQARR